MSRLTGVFCLCVLVAAMTPRAAVAEERSPRPDIVLIMADDMGFSDIGVYGSEIQTPVLDSLARGGLMFQQFYNAARCCPTRASLVTGLYSHQAGMGEMEPDRGEAYPGYRGNINRQSVTFAEALRVNGYRTYMTGKWHLTNRSRPDTSVDDKFNWPLQRGFDRYYGTIGGAGSFFGPHTLTRDNENIDGDLVFPGAAWGPPKDATIPVRDGGDFYYTDAINETSARFVREHDAQHGDQPLFLYVSHTAPHWPLHVPEEEIDKYMDVYMRGWDAVRRRRYERMIELGVMDASWELTPRDPAVASWEAVTVADLPAEGREAIEKYGLDYREVLARRMAVHAAMVDRMDRGIGDIVEALRETGRLHNTLILFLSDNGAASEWGAYGFGWPRLLANGARAGDPQSYKSIGHAWANVSNAPFRRYKLFSHEGGIATPLIVHWPAGIAARGEWREDVSHIIDVMPTLMEVSGSKYPERYAGYAIQPMEGVSLVPAFAGEPLARDGMIFWEHVGTRAVRDGDWKLVSLRQGDWELYDMRADRTEMHDLAGTHPDRVERMSAAWEAWGERANVLPMVWQQQQRAQQEATEQN